jgi:hypothetical protein
MPDWYVPVSLLFIVAGIVFFFKITRKPSKARLYDQNTQKICRRIERAVVTQSRINSAAKGNYAYAAPTTQVVEDDNSFAEALVVGALVAQDLSANTDNVQYDDRQTVSEPDQTYSDSSDDCTSSDCSSDSSSCCSDSSD